MATALAPIGWHGFTRRIATGGILAGARRIVKRRVHIPVKSRAKTLISGSCVGKQAKASVERLTRRQSARGVTKPTALGRALRHRC